MVAQRRAVDPVDALKILAEALAPYLSELLGLSNKRHLDDWVDVAEALPTCTRIVRRACRRGELPGRNIKRRWLVRRADLDAWIESHETGKKAEPKPQPVRALTPAEEHEQAIEAIYKELGVRRLTDAERAAKGLPPYDRNREYAVHLEEQKEREREKAERERADNDPKIAAQRAAAVRAADAARSGRPTKLPRIRCNRCGREVSMRKDGDPISHECPHRYGYRCRDAENAESSGTPYCPWCVQERAESGARSV